MRRVGSEEGAIAIMVAVVMVALLGVGALVIDVGFLQLERRKLQNGADAAALALAQACVLGEVSCSSQSAATTYAQTSFAAPNARGDTASVVCVRDGNAPVPTGTAWRDADAMSCPWLSSQSIRTFVRSQSDGGSVVRHVIAPLVAPDGADDATSIGATARVAWGSPRAGRTVPLAMCLAHFNAATSGGTTFPSAPQTLVYDIPTLSLLGCPAAGSGNFGWLRTTTSCYVLTGIGLANGEPGADFPNTSGCSSAERRSVLRAMVDNGSPGLIPIYDYTVDGGSNLKYNIVGYGAIRLQAFKLGGSPDNNHGPAIAGCGPNQRCLRVVFDQFIPTDQNLTEADLGGPDFGATVILLTN